MDPLTTNLVVADPERTTKTICLAVSPALKAYGIPGRARLFEVVRKVKEINDERKRKNGGHEFTGQSCDTGELKADRSFALDVYKRQSFIRCHGWLGHLGDCEWRTEADHRVHRERNHDGTVFSGSDVDIRRKVGERLEEETVAKR